ncbi:pilus assembly protein [Duganella sp. FT80W]|uniref:Pilus assembly protein n=1 Tax=Duganella guangzhouensis TaxID=2666084 RepID=A0A6I2KX53_9BURK|nr:TadE family protein [Duganella guangzhouensis]MRW90361.1 pilus assembly protein [Duganella guangzhouensis]
MSRAQRQRGQSATEFLVIFPALVMLVFGIIQMAFMYQGRATLNYAALLAARAGAMHNGDVGEMRRALSRGLAPLFASEASATGFADAMAKATAETAGPAALTSIEILNPTSAAFKDFGRDRLDATSGKELPNDTLAYRTSSAGTNSKQSVQDANLLHVRVTYCFRLIVPVIDRIIQTAFNSGAPSSEGKGMSDPFGLGVAPAGLVCNNPALGGRRIYIQSEAIVRMQSSFFEANLAGANAPGTPGPSTPGDDDSPGGPVDPSDPGDPTNPNPGDPVCI